MLLLRDREERRLKTLKNKQLSQDGNLAEHNHKSAPPRLTAATDQAQPNTKPVNNVPASTLKLDSKSEGASEDDIAYQSTLLHMRVVGRCFHILAYTVQSQNFYY